MRKAISTVWLRQIRPEIATVGDGIVDFHVDTEDDLPAGRYYVTEMHDRFVIVDSEPPAQSDQVD